MDMASWLLLMVLAVIGWYWFNSLRAMETAKSIGRQHCGELNLQFLDDTVASNGLGLGRDPSGRRVFRRTYRFEFSETGNTRLEGELILLGDKLESVTLEPYRVDEEANLLDRD